MQTLAPIHLLPKRDGPLDRWRGGHWGMNNPAAYTPLETLLLFQAVATHGAQPSGFAKVSDELTKNPQIRADKTYDATRLSPDALRRVFLHVWSEELGSGKAAADKTDGSSSPNSKKRKLSRPAVPTLKEAKAQVHQYPMLVDRLWVRWRDSMVESVKDDERRLNTLAREITELHTIEQAEKAKAAAQLATAPNGSTAPKATPVPAPVPSPSPNHVQAPAAQPQAKPSTPAPAPETPRPIRPAPAQTPVPVTPVPLPPQAQIKQPTPSAQGLPPAPPPVPTRRDVAPPAGAFHQSPVPPPVQPASAAGAPGAAPATAAPIKSHQPLKPPNGAGQVLQAPVGAVQPPGRPGQSTSPVPLPAISPRPDSIAAKTRTSGPAITTNSSPQLRWETPYQPPAAPQQQGRPSQVPPAASAPLTPNQQHNPSQWYAQQQANQYHGPPHSPNMPTQANQGNRYPQQAQPVLVPPQGQTQPPRPPYPQPPLPPQNRPHTQGQVQPQSHAPNQAKGQLVAPMHSTPVKGPQEAPASQNAGRPMSTTPIAPPVLPQPTQHHQQAQQAQQPVETTNPPPSRPTQPPTSYQPHPHQRPLAAASPTPPPALPPQTAVPHPKWPQPPPQIYAQQQFSPTPAPAQLPAKAAENQRRVSSPLVKQQPPRPAIPAHLNPQVSTPTQTPRAASTPIPPPQTPVTASPIFHLTGSSTKWNWRTTPSTPRPAAAETQSPAIEPLSPVQQPAPVPVPLPTSTPSQLAKKASPKLVPKQETKTPKGRGRPPRSANKIRAGSTPSSAVGVPRRSQSVTSQTDELAMDLNELAPRVKDEHATPRATPRATPKPHDETGDTTADESVPSRKNLITPSNVSSRLAQKRKRQDSPVDSPPGPPTHVLWTRQFGRVSAAALDQIGAHRFANQFANPIRERDAPGYKTIILQPQDIKSIRAAITHGNRAATEAAKALPDGDPGTGSVLVPISDDLVPPKSIINSAQLERELFHMFANAVMYNPNPSRGPGPAFMKVGISAGADALGYEVDEDAVVRSTRMMAGEVEKIIGELRNAEKERTGQAPSTSGNTRPTSVATGEDTPMAEDDVDELAGDADIGSTTRRRRVGTRN
ncbi:hypothetical protein CkaCkLH20_03793 [Colletotrichum karsti]|uniref:Bromo domain-containing protein n=1 Tax=Colletotrichum karsti TaxID=1095194 RepID=A0A9P6LMJ4_9PEZI|nr:uncharacterized protein CkaCkLH20_03793 [Colletotrichum karsti]KAF9878893.1 hypothetical protein CkaCkLH20_03793 [Colletotrichum karsti]